MGLTGTPAAFARGFEIGEHRRDLAREHKEKIEDEQRQLNVQDWFQQRSAIRDRAKKLNLQGDDLKAEEDKIAALSAKINDAYHPAKAPGALQKDWHFLQGLLRIHGRGDKPAPAPPTIAGTKTPDVTIQQPDETVKLPADTTPVTTAVGADQTGKEIFDKLPPIPGLAANLNPIVHTASQMFKNVPPAFIAAVIGQESGGRTNAVSSKGATGVMQLMPETAAQYGVKDATNPVENIIAGTHYLSDLITKHGGNLAEAAKDYYGRGKAPAGDPTTDKYAADVLGAYSAILGKMPAVTPAAPPAATPAATPAPVPAPALAPPGAATLSPFEQVKMQTMPGAKDINITLPSSPITIPGTTQSSVTGPASTTMAVPPAKIKGLVAAGNLPIWNRPVIQNDDGTVSSEYSTSFTDENPNSPYYGKEVLVPTVVNGKFLTPDGKKPEEGSDAEKAMFEAARGQYQKTGQMLGVFEDPKSADKYAQQLHSRGERKQPDAGKYETKQDKQQKAQQTAKDKAAEEAEQFMAAGPLTPAEEAQADMAKKKAEINSTMEIAKELLGPDWSEDDQKEFKESLINANLGTGTKEKYFSQIIPMEDPVTKETRYYRVPMSGAPPQEITGFRGQTMLAKPGASTGTKGSDFWKTVVAKYGQNPTAEQVEAERQLWTMAGAKGSETITDAAGNSIRVPTFASGQQIPAGLIAGDSTGGGAGVTPQGGADGATESASLTPSGPPRADDPAFRAPDPNRKEEALAEARRLGIEDDVKAVANYQMPLGSSTGAARSGQRKFQELVLKVNPAYTQGHYQQVQNTLTSFAPSGTHGMALQSLNMTIHHVASLLDKIDALNNGDYPLLNKWKNFGSAATGSPQVAEFITAAQAVASEAGKVFRGTGSLTEGEENRWLAGLDPNMSPAQLQGQVRTMIDLMAGRMVSETTSYKGTMGTLGGFPTLDDESRQVLSGGRVKVRGAQQMLELDQEARNAGGPSTAPAQPRPQVAPDGFVYARDAQGNWYKSKPGQALPPGLTIVPPPAQ